MSLKKTMAKYPRVSEDVIKTADKWMQKNLPIKCDRCGHVFEAGEKYRLVTTQVSFMRGDDECETTCHPQCK